MRLEHLVSKVMCDDNVKTNSQRSLEKASFCRPSPCMLCCLYKLIPGYGVATRIMAYCYTKECLLIVGNKSPQNLGDF